MDSQTLHPAPTVSHARGGQLILTREHRDLAANLGAVVRFAVARTSSEASCAAMLGVSVRRLRQIASAARVPLMFVATPDEAGRDR